MHEQGPPKRPSAWLLDLTRLTTRVGRGPLTGIDRVEAAYLRHLLAETTPLFGLVRTSLGFVILDREGMQAFQGRILGKTEWGRLDLLSRVNPKARGIQKVVESDLRRLCIQRARPKGLPRMLRNVLPEGFVWLNVGHTNLKQRVFDAIKSVKNARSWVMVHDMIPLIYPQFQKVGTVDLFKRRMQSIGKNVDKIIYNSHQSKRDAEGYFQEWGRVPEGMVAHLGVETPSPKPDSLPAELDLSEPYFVTIGTIEPRKNHALLLDVWQKLGTEDEPPPTLYIIGNRGWENETVFARLDAKPAGIIELNNLNDATMAALVQNARAALFPSLAEGFGLPPCEAIMLGTPVIAADLEVTKEILGNIPIYANALDMYSWLQIIHGLIVNTKVGQSKKEMAETIASLPTWQKHFNLVLSLV